MSVAMLYSEGLKEYDFGPGHPFRGDRYLAFPAYLKETIKPEGNYTFMSADPASDEDLLKICQGDYIDFTRQFFATAHAGLSYDGRFYQYHSADNHPIGRPGDLEAAARLVIGQAKRAADIVQSGEYQKVVSIGGGLHHAKTDYGEGFCLYNDVAFTAMYLMEKYKLERVLILDTDAHAGNGTADYFYSSSKVLFIDLHQDPATLYPGTGFAHETGAGAGAGFTINVPLPVYAGNASYALVFDEIVEPVAREFQPQVIIRNGGSDPYVEDGLTRLGLTVAGFRMIGERVRKLAGLCEGKLIDLIASGYNPRVLPQCWLALLSGVAGFDVDIQEPLLVPARLKSEFTLEETKRVVAQVKRAHKPYWRCFN